MSDPFEKVLGALAELRDELRDVLGRWRGLPIYIGAIRNGGTPCDMMVGACACGAWHKADEWPLRLSRARFF